MTDTDAILRDVSAQVDRLTDELGRVKFDLAYHETTTSRMRFEMRELRAAYFRALAALWLATIRGARTDALPVPASPPVGAETPSGPGAAPAGIHTAAGAAEQGEGEAVPAVMEGAA